MFDLIGFQDEAARILFNSHNIGTYLTGIFKLLKKNIPVDEINIFYISQQTQKKIRICSVKGGTVDDSILCIDCPIKLDDSMTVSSEDVFYHSYNNSPLPKKWLDFIDIKGKSDMVLNIKNCDNIVGAVIIRAFSDNVYNEYHKQLINQLKYSFSMFFFNSIICDKLLDENLNSQVNSNELKAIINNEEVLNSDIIGANTSLKCVLNKAMTISKFSSSVLLMGETGVGKEVIANLIHKASPRRDAPFIKINCGAFSESLIENELFGHEKGAFTGADSVQNGRFQMADTGTLFLDEVAELPMQSQVKLLRALQFGEINRLGNGKTIKVDARIIAATNKNIDNMLANGEFREDLFWRLNVFPIEIPPLRERKCDIPDLVNYFLMKKCSKLKIKKIPNVSSEVMRIFLDYSWPGNIRELENIIERELILGNGSLKADLVQASLKQQPSKIQDNINDTVLDDMTLDNVIKNHIESVLQKAEMKISGTGGAADMLGVNPSTLRNKMKRLNIDI